jgi:hypothetical protein
VRINKKKRQQNMTPGWYLIAAARFHLDMHHIGNQFNFQLNYGERAGRGRGVRKDNRVYSGRGDFLGMVIRWIPRSSIPPTKPIVAIQLSILITGQHIGNHFFKQIALDE